MQNTSTASHPGGSSHQNWQTPNLPSNMYATGQRSTSNPRSYSDMGGVGQDGRREDGQQAYATDGYGYPSSANYGAVQNVGYPSYSGQGMGLQSYSTTSPANAPRRTSGPKAASTPPASAPPAGNNSSPASRYYPNQGTPDPNSSISAPSPYQPSSAPAQVTNHQQQPQTAHPYGGGYYNYYDGQHQNQWASSHYNQPSYQQQSRAPAASTPQTAVADNAHRTSSQTSAYDYSQYPGYAGHERSASAPHQSWQAPLASNRYSTAAQGSQAQQQWQGGYPSHHMPQSMAPHHMNQGMAQGQYPGWQQHQQWNPQYGYPMTPHTAGQPGAAVPPAHTIAKKEGKDYDGLGKRAVDSSTEDEDEKDGKKRKGKKEVEPVEKPAPKPPAKSHLHPPRQAQSMWQLFFTDELNKAKASAASGNSPGGTPHHAKLNVAQIAKDAGIAYSNLTPEQKAHYVRKVQESKDQYAKELAAWQATLTPEDIRVENAFRAQQRKEGKSRKGNLKDPNAPKKPLSAYFLFLKGIREDDALRARVWGEESETTKQSVLAAERWRSLNDEEKRPFLAQAEKDKQEYEAARKIYEEDAAARARGEEVPVRTYPEPALDVPKPVLREATADDLASDAQAEPTLGVTESTQVKPETTTIPFDFMQHDSDEQIPTTGSIDAPAPTGGMEDFQAFPDPLGDLDLGGFQTVEAGRTNGGSADWGELGNLMGGEEPKVPMESEDVSVAPALNEAVQETHQDTELDQGLPSSEQGVQEVAAAAEGDYAIPSTLEPPIVGAESTGHSGLPTEEVSEMPKELPPVETQAAFEPAASAESNDLFAEPNTVEQGAAETQPTEAAQFSEVIQDAEPSPALPSVTAEASSSNPLESVSLPQSTTVEPATDASNEAPAEPTPQETEAPAADNV